MREYSNDPLEELWNKSINERLGELESTLLKESTKCSGMTDDETLIFGGAALAVTCDIIEGLTMLMGNASEIQSAYGMGIAGGLMGFCTLIYAVHSYVSQKMWMLPENQNE